MIVKHRLNLDLINRGVTQRIDAVQDDKYSRELEIRLFANGVEFMPPEDCTVLVRYKKPDGTGGAYDTLPDGSSAWRIADGVLTVALAPQVCTAAGIVELAVTLLGETAEISTFLLLLDVQASPGGTGSSREYVNIKAFLPQPGNVAVGEYLMVTEVDAYGNATVIGSHKGGADGVSPTISVEETETGHRVTITDADGSQSFHVSDGTDSPDSLRVYSAFVMGTLPAGRAKGDINGDGHLDETDVELLNAHIMGNQTITDETALWAADLDGSGVYDANDVLCLRRSIADAAVYGNYAADFHGNWQYDRENGYFCYDIAAPCMTGQSDVTLVPGASPDAGSFIGVVPMEGALRFCFRACPNEALLCRILYYPGSGQTRVTDGVENSFLDPILTQEHKNEIVAAVLEALPGWDGGEY